MNGIQKLLLAAGVLAVTSSSTFAGTGSGRLANPNFMPNGAVVIYIEGSRNAPPTCATESRRFVLNAATPAGKAQLAGLMLAYTQGKTVNVWGTNSCSVWGDTETIDFFAIVDGP